MLNRKEKKHVVDECVEKHSVCDSTSESLTPPCADEKCDFPCKYCLNPETLACKFKDAVVEVHSEFILLGKDAPAVPSGSTQLEKDVRFDVVLEGNGFFIKGHYIVAPAQLVLLPPSLTSVANRYPYLNSSDLDLGVMKSQLVRASRILISVFNVNGKGKSFVYEADLVGVDGAGDIAVLKINYRKPWNKCNPCVEPCHPRFKFGSSRASKPGEKVYLIGDYVSNPYNRRLFSAVGAISAGILSDHRHLDYSGFSLAENVLVSAPAYAFSAGLPILNCEGLVIGMQTFDVSGVLPGINEAAPDIENAQQEGRGMVAGPSEFFMKRVVKTIIAAQGCGRKVDCQTETIFDPIGSFIKYKKGYLGIAYELFTGSDYDTTSEYTSSAPYPYPRVRLDANGEFLSSPPIKEIVGIKVLGLAGLNPSAATGVANGYWYVPGGTGPAPLLPLTPVSPFLGKIQPGDVITHINGIAVGDISKQIAPSIITWRLCSGDCIELCYLRGGNALNTGDNAFAGNYENYNSYSGSLLDFPAFMDYPWYAVNTFPLVSNFFTFPPEQITNPQFPSLKAQGGDRAAQFHPAI